MCSLLTGWATAVASDAAVPAASRGSEPPALAQVTLPASCAPWEAGTPQPVADTKAWREEVTRLSKARDPQSLALACAGWLHAKQVALEKAPAPAPSTALGQLHVGMALTWLGQSLDAQAWLNQAYGAFGSDASASDEAGAAAGLLGVVHFAKGDYAEAVGWTRRAVERLTAPGTQTPQEEQLHLRLNFGTLLGATRRFDEARALLRSLVEEVDTPDQRWPAVHAAAIHSLAIGYRRQGNLDQARHFNRLELALRERNPAAGRPVDLANAYQDAAVLAITSHQYPEAQKHLDRALELFAKLDSDAYGAHASAWETNADLLMSRGGAPKEAVASAQRAVDLIRGSKSVGAQGARFAKSLRRLSQAQLAAGDIAAAMATVREAMASLDRSPKSQDVFTETTVRLQYARLQLLLGEPGQAEQAVARAFERAGEKRLADPEHAALLLVRGAASLQANNAEAAGQALAQADAAAAGNLPISAGLRVQVAALSCSELAVNCDRVQALLDGPASENPALRSELALALAKRALVQSKVVDSLSWSDLALVAAAQASSRELLQRAYASRAQSLHLANRVDEAIFFGKQAAASIAAARSEVAAGVGKSAVAGYLAGRAPVLRHLATWLAQTGRIPEAVEVLALLKGVEQSDFVERAAASGAAQTLRLQPAEQAMFAELENYLSLTRERAARWATLQQRAASGRASSAERLELASLSSAGSALQSTQQRIWSLTSARIQRLTRSPSQIQSQRAGPADSPLGGGLARPDTLHVYYVMGDEQITTLFVTATGRHVEYVPIQRAALSEQIASLLDAARSRSRNRPSGVALHRLLGQAMDAAAQRYRVGRIAISSDLDLRYLPFGLIHDGQRFLAQKYVLANHIAGMAPLPLERPQGRAAPSPPPAGVKETWDGPAFPSVAGSALANAAGDLTRPRIRAFGVTQAAQGLPALAGVAREICQIVDGRLEGWSASDGACEPGDGNSRFRGVAYLNAAFTAQAFAATAANESAGHLLHVGTHFVMNPGNAEQSWLLTGDAQRLSVSELVRMPLGAPALVTLSACETAVPSGNADGREVDSLAASFLGRGARAVVASHWPVSDQATAGLMADFYTALKANPADPARALWSAQQRFRARHPGDPTWAAFALFETP
jgi:CHAT domain-containing protein